MCLIHTIWRWLASLVVSSTQYILHYNRARTVLTFTRARIYRSSRTTARRIVGSGQFFLLQKTGCRGARYFCYSCCSTCILKMSQLWWQSIISSVVLKCFALIILLSSTATTQKWDPAFVDVDPLSPVVYDCECRTKCTGRSYVAFLLFILIVY